jgi:hypothetical protein
MISVTQKYMLCDSLYIKLKISELTSSASIRIVVAFGVKLEVGD